MTNLLFACVAGLTLFCAFAFAAFSLLKKSDAAAGRLTELLGGSLPPATPRKNIWEGVTHWAGTLQQRFSKDRDAQGRERLQSAGLSTATQRSAFFAVRWLAPLAGLAAGSFYRSNIFLACVVLAAAGYLLPDMWLRRRVRRYREKLRASLPDALDLLNICVDAGLGLDQAMIRVSDELALSHPGLHSEFQRVQLEQRVGGNRMDAWRRFAARSEMEEISSFVSMLSQSERFGTPIARALSRFAEDLRTQRRQNAEEAAAKTRVKIVFPLVFFIFPCLFIVLLAPALMGLFGALKDLR